MNLKQLRDALRDDIRDSTTPYLVSDGLAARLLNEAEMEAARRARLLVDSTSAMTQIAVTAGNPLVSLDPRIIKVRRARLASQVLPLQLRSVATMDAQYAGWDSDSVPASVPQILVVGADSGVCRLYPPPINADTLQLIAVREPLALMSADDDAPEVPPRTHEGLLNWAKWRVYSNDDADLYDPKRAATAYQAFEAEFGPKRAIIDEAFEAENYHGIGEF